MTSRPTDVTDETTEIYAERYDADKIREVLALMDPIPNEDDLTLDTQPVEDEAGFTAAMREDLLASELIEYTSHFDCATEEALAAMKTLGYLEVEKIHEEVWQLYANAQG